MKKGLRAMNSTSINYVSNIEYIGPFQIQTTSIISYTYSVVLDNTTFEKETNADRNDKLAEQEPKIISLSCR